MIAFKNKRQQRRHSCTGAFALGLTSAKGNMLGKTCDWFVPPEGCMSKVRLVIPDEGYRFLDVGCGGYVDEGGYINEKGVCSSDFLREGRAIPYPKKGKGEPERMYAEALMAKSGTAKEYVALWSESLTRYGTGYETGGEARMIMDGEEGYLVEALDFVVGNPSNHAIHGPMTDQVFAHANFYLAKVLREHQSGLGAGYSRARRAWELLVKQQYNSITLQPLSGSGVTLPYFMGIFRDHGNLTPEEGRMSGYAPETTGMDAVCHHGIFAMTINAHVLIPGEKHPDLLSCGWTTFSQPCLSPFLPFYVGINSVPETFTTTAAAEVFNTLRLTLEYHPEHRAKITHYWRTFEIQTIEETISLEGEVAHLAESRKVDEARKRLTGFVTSKCSEALSAADKMIRELEGLPTMVSL